MEAKTLSRIFIIIPIIYAIGISKNVDIPDSSSGRLFKAFLNAVETGEIEPFVKKHFTQEILDKISLAEHMRFLGMMHRMHGGFTVFEIVESEEHKIVTICKSKKRNAWREFLIATSNADPEKIIGIDVMEAPPPESYLAGLPKLQIERPLNDDAIVEGRMAENIDEYMTGLESVGYSGGLIIYEQGRLILAKGYGYADRENKKIFDRNTVFTIGSITKQFTGAAIVKLESMGKISFQDSITEYFEDVPRDKQEITIHQLATHTAGFRGAIGDDRERITRNDFVETALKSKLLFEPGERYSYSNVGYSLLAAIVEKTAGVSYESFLKKFLFLPAGMKQTGYSLPGWSAEDILTGYSGEEKWGKPTDLMWGEDGPGWHLKGNGGILSTLDDMMKWGHAVLGNEVFTDKEKKAYLTPYVSEGPSADSHYAYGWVRMKSSRGTDLITHNGGNPYIQNDMYIFPQDDVIMYVTSNNGDFSAIDQSQKILRMVFETK